MAKQKYRKPTEKTIFSLKDLLPVAVDQLAKQHRDRPDLILASWAEVIGAKLAPLAEAVAFHKGVLRVKVKSSTLYALLCQSEGDRLLKQLKRRFPHVAIRKIDFRIG